jgi:hypothetical protein
MYKIIEAVHFLAFLEMILTLRPRLEGARTAGHIEAASNI